MSVDFAGDDAAHSIFSLLTSGGYQLSDPQAYCLVLIETASGATNARMGGPDVSATKGIPLSTTDKMIFSAVSGHVGDARSWLWQMDQMYVYVPSGDAVSITAWVR